MTFWDMGEKLIHYLQLGRESQDYAKRAIVGPNPAKLTKQLSCEVPAQTESLRSFECEALSVILTVMSPVSEFHFSPSLYKSVMVLELQGDLSNLDRK